MGELTLDCPDGDEATPADLGVGQTVGGQQRHFPLRYRRTPSPNTQYEGTIATANDEFRIVVNEQTVNTPTLDPVAVALHALTVPPTTAAVKSSALSGLPPRRRVQQRQATGPVTAIFGRGRHCGHGGHIAPP